MSPIVMTRQGPVEGEQVPELLVFRGIPYAAAPIGERRFKAPEPPDPWSATLEARAFGPAAPQPKGILSGDANQSEDCLHVNVWTPGVDGQRRPVMAWVHGGGFAAGASSQDVYDGAALARRGDVVVVTFNYRLGALGLLDLRSVPGAAGRTDSNLTLRDQIAALEWVRDNIEAFGGDPGCVTLFGESAGGMSVATLLASPRARGLFHRAIAQSGAAHHVVSEGEAARMTALFLGALGLDAAGVDELWRLPTERLLEAQLACLQASVLRGPPGKLLPQFGMTLLPVAEAGLVPVDPLQAIARGEGSALPLMVGTTADEWNFFVFLTDQRKLTLDDAALLKVCETRVPAHAARLIAGYRAGLPEGATLPPWRLFSMIETDRNFRVPALRLAAAHAATVQPVYNYLFDWASPLFDGRMGSCHFLDVPFVFDTVGSPVGRFFAGSHPAAEALATAMTDAWISFARHGRPSSPGLPTWEAYRPEHPRAMRLALDAAMVPATSEAIDSLWTELC